MQVMLLPNFNVVKSSVTEVSILDAHTVVIVKRVLRRQELTSSVTIVSMLLNVTTVAKETL